MKIESYNVRMDSAVTKNVTSTRKLGVGFTQGLDSLKNLTNSPFAGSLANYSNANEEDNEPKDSVTGSGDNANNLWKRFQDKPLQNIASIRNANDHGSIRDIHSVKQQFVLYLWRMLFGDNSAKKLQEKYGITDLNQSNGNEISDLPSNITPIDKATNTITLYGVQEYYYSEEQNLSFTSQGTVTTADGRTIDFSVDLSMSSRFETYYYEQTNDVIRMCDPLVLNFDGDIAGLSDQKFMFDLDADGTEEEISMLSSGNGFLALDSNNDGIINDGSELFGTKSGDGFSDLSAYDKDHNGWIDENDEIFDKLKIWTKNAEGEDELMSLKDKGVGAIYLGNSNTDYLLRGSLGQANGALRKTGFFLYENAGVGTIAHLDIAN